MHFVMYTKGTHLCVATCNLYSAWNITLAMIASTHVCGSKVHHHDNHHTMMIVKY